MRRSFLILPGLLVAGAAAAGGWYALNPGDPMAQARSMTQQGNLRGALLVLRDFVRNHPDRADAHLRLGEVQLNLGDSVAAEHELRQASERGADEHAVRPLLAQALVGQNQGSAVLRDFNADGLDARQSADLHVARALAAASLKQPDLARKEIAAARLAAPDSIDVALNAARILRVTGDLDAASQAIDAALAIDPHSAVGLVLRAQLLVQQGQMAAALAAYDVVLANPSKTPDLAGVYLARASLQLQNGNDAAARQDTDAALKIAPRNPLGNYMTALLSARAGQWKAADEALNAVGPSLDRLPRGDILLATVKMKIGEPQQALDAAERFNGHNPNDLTGAKLLAQIDLAQGRAPAVIRLLSPWNTPDGADPEVLAMLSQAYAKAGRNDEAQATLRKAATVSQGDAGILARIAGVAMGEGNARLAADMFQTALAQEPSLPGLKAAAAQPVAQTGPVQATPAVGTPNPGTPSRADTAAALILTALRAGQIDRAAAALDTLRDAHGDPEQLDMLTGGVRLGQSDLSGARAAFESALARNPAAVPAIVNLAQVMRLQGDPDGAASLLRSALTKQPANPALVVAFVEFALARNTPNDAVAVTEAAHAAAPADANLTGILANLYLRTGQPAKALTLADGLPADTPAQLGLRADAERALGHGDAAVAAWQALIAKAPADVPLRRRIASFMLADKHDDAAAQLLRDGLTAYPKDPGLQADAVALAARKDGLAAGIARADAFADHTTELAPLLLKGNLLVANGKFSEAATAFAQARATLPKDAPLADGETLVLRQAAAMNGAGDKAGGLKLMQDWQTSHPDSLLTLEALAENDIAAGYLPEARSKLETVLKGQPNNAAALNNMAWIQQQQGQLDAARANASQAYLLFPGPQTADTLGWIFLHTGRAADGLALLRQAAGGQPSDPSIQYHLAVALKQTDKPDEAKTVLQPVVDSGAQFGERAQAIELLQSLKKS